jgi:DNA modification methylase
VRHCADGRYNFDTADKAKYGVLFEKWARTKAKQAHKEGSARGGSKALVPGPKPSEQQTHKICADIAGVGEATMKRALAVAKKGVDELNQAVFDDKTISVKAGERVAQLEPEQQQQVVEKVRDGAKVKTAINQVKARTREEKVSKVVPISCDAEIVCADVLEWLHILEDESVSCVVTDPPYNVTTNQWDQFETTSVFWEWMGEWLEALKPKLAPKYHVFVFCDSMATIDLHDTMCDLGYEMAPRPYIWHRPNLAKKRSGDRWLLGNYETVWHAGNHSLNLPARWGDERFAVQTHTVPQSNHVEDPSFHPTQKPLSLIRNLVQVGSRVGGLVVDPFVGSGTTAVASLELQRRFRGCDQEQRFVDIARGRCATAQHPGKSKNAKSACS